MICNKIDKLVDHRVGLERDDEGRPVRLWLSAQTGEGCESLFTALTELLAGSMVHHTLQLPPSAARLRSALYRLKGIEQEGFSEEGNFVLQVRLKLADWNRLVKQEGENLQRFIRH
jgi:GTP-binding protein HflX